PNDFFKGKKNKNRSTNESNAKSGSAIVLEIVVNYIFEALLTNCSSDNYLFKQKFFVALDLLFEIINIDSEEQNNKEITQHLIN
ncbi:23673_t:CDS:2, partial [Cetraspora pellucida]